MLPKGENTVLKVLNPLIFAISVIMSIAVFVFDYYTNIDMNLFYLVPVAFVAWRTHSKAISTLTTIFSIACFSYLQFQNFVIGPFLWKISINLIFCLVFSFVLIKLKKAIEREKNNARTDFLTGIKNKQGFYESIAVEKERFSRSEKPFTIVFLDLDNFKIVNDNYGHDRGDKLLISISSILVENIRKYDVAARIGGDEFALLLVESDPALVEQRLNRLKDVMNHELRKIHSSVSVSMGAVTYTKPRHSYEDMIKETDIEMYLVKRNGKNGINHIVK